MNEDEGKRHRLRHRFQVLRKLGQGTYGKVQLAVNRDTGQQVAIKTIKKSKIESDHDLVRIRREIQIMSSIQHPHIIHIHEVFENQDKIVLVMQYASGGEMYDYLASSRCLADPEARRVFRQISSAIYYCHKNKICHRDLKLENILLDDRKNVKIADFGLSNLFEDGQRLRTFCGSPLYASPEIVRGTPYCGPEVDCWSLGVLLYTLVYGVMPFDGSNHRRLVRQISDGSYSEPPVKSGASDLIRRLLTVDPQKRATIKDVCSDPWINQGRFDQTLLQVAEDMSKLTPVRLDLLLALAPNSIDKMKLADNISSPSSSIASPQQPERCSNTQADCDNCETPKSDIKNCSSLFETCNATISKPSNEEKLEDLCLLKHEEATSVSKEERCEEASSQNDLADDPDNIIPESQNLEKAKEQEINQDEKIQINENVEDKENEDPHIESLSKTHSIIEEIQTKTESEEFEKALSTIENMVNIPNEDLSEQSRLLQKEIDNLKTLSNLFSDAMKQEENKPNEDESKVEIRLEVNENKDTKPFRKLGLKKNSKIKCLDQSKSEINEVLDQLTEEMKKFVESEDMLANPENVASSESVKEILVPNVESIAENKDGSGMSTEQMNNLETTQTKYVMNTAEVKSIKSFNDLTNLQPSDKKGQFLKSKIPIKSKDSKLQNTDRKGSFDKEINKVTTKISERKLSGEKGKSLLSLKMNEVKKSNENISNKVPKTLERRHSSYSEKSSRANKQLERKNSNDIDLKKLQNSVKTNGKMIKPMERKNSHENGLNKSPSPSKSHLKNSASEGNRSQKTMLKSSSRKGSVESVVAEASQKISKKTDKISNSVERNSKEENVIDNSATNGEQDMNMNVGNVDPKTPLKDEISDNTIDRKEIPLLQPNTGIEMEVSNNQKAITEKTWETTKQQTKEKTTVEEKKETAINILKRKIMLECKSPPPKPVTNIKKPGKISIPKFLNSSEETSKSHQSQKETIILSRRVSDAKKDIETKIEERRRSSVVIVRRPSLAVERLRKRSAPSTMITEEMLEKGEFTEEYMEDYEETMHDGEEYYDSLNEQEKIYENNNEENRIEIDEIEDNTKKISGIPNDADNSLNEKLKENTVAIVEEDCDSENENKSNILIPKNENEENLHITKNENEENLYITKNENEENLHITKNENEENLYITKSENGNPTPTMGRVDLEDDDDYRESLKVLEECINQICKNTLCGLSEEERSNLETEIERREKNEDRRDSLQSNYETPPEFNSKSSGKFSEDVSSLDAMDAEIAKWAEMFQTDLKRLSPEGASEDSACCSKLEKRKSSLEANAKDLNGDLCYVDISGDSSESTGNEANFKGKKSRAKLENSKNEISGDLSDDEFDIHFDDSQPIMYGSQSLWNFLKAINDDLTNHLKMIKMATNKSTKYRRSLSTDQRQEKLPEDEDGDNDDTRSVRSIPAYSHSISLDSRYRPSRRPIWDENKWEEEFSKLSNPENLYPSMYATTRRTGNYLDRYRAVSHSPNRDQIWSDEPALDNSRNYLKPSPSHRRYSRYGDTDSRHHSRSDRSRSLCRRYFNEVESSPEDYSWSSSLKRRPSKHDTRYPNDSKNYDRLSKYERRKSYRESTRGFDASNLYLDQLEAEDSQAKSAQLESEKLDVNKILEELDKDSLLAKLKTKGYENMVSQRLNQTGEVSKPPPTTEEEKDQALEQRSTEINDNAIDCITSKNDRTVEVEEAFRKPVEAPVIKNQIFPNPKYYATSTSRRRKSADCFLKESDVSKSQLMLMETKRILNSTLKSMSNYDDQLPGDDKGKEQNDGKEDASRGDESVSERIWRKSFYSRFNDQHSRRRRYRDSELWDSCLSLADEDLGSRRTWKSTDMPTCDSGIASTSHRSLSRCSLQDEDQTV